MFDFGRESSSRQPPDPEPVLPEIPFRSLPSSRSSELKWAARPAPRARLQRLVAPPRVVERPDVDDPLAAGLVDDADESLAPRGVGRRGEQRHRVDAAGEERRGGGGGQVGEVSFGALQEVHHGQFAVGFDLQPPLAPRRSPRRAAQPAPAAFEFGRRYGDRRARPGFPPARRRPASRRGRRPRRSPPRRRRPRG